MPCTMRAFGRVCDCSVCRAVLGASCGCLFVVLSVRARGWVVGGGVAWSKRESVKHSLVGSVAVSA